MGDYDFKNSDTVKRLGVKPNTAVSLYLPSTIESDDRRKEVDLQKDGYVTFRFVGDDFDDVFQDGRGSDLLSVWDICFTKGEYEKRE